MIAYEKHINKNSNEWITLVHGAGGSSSIWNKQIDYFSKYFNLLLVDLRGHGKSAQSHLNVTKYSFNAVTKDILEVLDKEKIIHSHFVGISLGSLIIRNFANLYPERVTSCVLGGMITKINFFSKVLLFYANLLINILPVQTLYKILANLILPRKSHNASKQKYIVEAKKITTEEFFKWFNLNKEIKNLLRSFNKICPVPLLIIQGQEDHLFVNDVKKYVEIFKNVNLKVLPKCGHVVNIQSAELFNKYALSFIQSHKKVKESITKTVVEDQTSKDLKNAVNKPVTTT